MNEQHAAAVEYARTALETGAASAAGKGVYAGAGFALGGSLSQNELIGIAGLVVAILSYITTAAIKFRLARAELRSIRAREEREIEAHRLLQEQHIREAEEHTARMGLY